MSESDENPLRPLRALVEEPGDGEVDSVVGGELSDWYERFRALADEAGNPENLVLDEDSSESESSEDLSLPENRFNREGDRGFEKEESFNYKLYGDQEVCFSFKVEFETVIEGIRYKNDPEQCGFESGVILKAVDEQGNFLMGSAEQQLRFRSLSALYRARIFKGIYLMRGAQSEDIDILLFSELRQNIGEQRTCFEGMTPRGVLSKNLDEETFLNVIEEELDVLERGYAYIERMGDRGKFEYTDRLNRLLDVYKIQLEKKEKGLKHNARCRELAQDFYPNGVYESDLKQGRVGNCYLLAGLQAARRTNPELFIRAFERNVKEVDGYPGYFDVTFPGSKSGFQGPYRIKLKGLVNEIMNDGTRDGIPVYSVKKWNLFSWTRAPLGDLVLETAYAVFRERMVKHGEVSIDSGDHAIEGGHEHQALYHFFGDEYAKDKRIIKADFKKGFAKDGKSDVVREALTAFARDNSYLMSFGTVHHNFLELVRGWFKTKHHLPGGHAYAAIHVDQIDQKILIENPHETASPFSISYQEVMDYFYSLSFIRLVQDVDAFGDRPVEVYKEGGGGASTMFLSPMIDEELAKMTPEKRLYVSPLGMAISIALKSNRLTAVSPLENYTELLNRAWARSGGDVSILLNIEDESPEIIKLSLEEILNQKGLVLNVVMELRLKEALKRLFQVHGIDLGEW